MTLDKRHLFVFVNVGKLRKWKMNLVDLKKARFICKYSPRRTLGGDEPVDSHSSIWPDPGVRAWPTDDRKEAFRHAVQTFLAECAETHIVKALPA